MIETDLKELRKTLGEISDLNSSLALLSWDQQTYMPPKGAVIRGRQQATLSALAHQKFVSEEFGEQMQRLHDRKNELSTDDRSLVEVSLYDYDRAVCLPEEFVEELTIAQSAGFEAWVAARKENDFTTFLPHLEKLIDLARRKADYHGYEGTPYNALLEDFEPGMTAEQLDRIFGELALRQSKLVERIAASPVQPDTSWLQREWPKQPQFDFARLVLQDIGFDYERGRQDLAPHPFTTSLSAQDVRLTTRISSEEPFSCLTGSIHEGGHGLYEQGFAEHDVRTPLANCSSLGIHESQSRTWENIIGRSLPFWQHYTPQFKQYMGEAASGISVEQIFRAINRVSPSLIRVEADECTYNLHIILRYEIERALLEGRISAREIPEAWNARMKELLGIDVPDDASGSLQDIHWSMGMFGYFPTYALGNLYAAQMFEQVEKELPGLWSEIEAGQFTGLLNWLRKNVHLHGRRKLAHQIIEDSTGSPPVSGPYLQYLESKYGSLYAL